MLNKCTILDTLDDPAIIERLASRREMLRRTGRLGGVLALASVPAALGVFAKSAFAQSTTLPQQIKDVLNFALTLEHLENEFYRTALASSGLIPAADVPVFRQISQHETAHVALLQSTLGADAVAKPTFDFTAGGQFGDVFTNYATFQALSQGFEDTGVRAFKGQVTALQSNDDILTTALRIHSVEARHASEVRRLRGQKGWVTGNTTDVPALTPVYAGEDNTTQAGVALPAGDAASEAFDEPLSMDQVLAIANRFIKK
ncbi:MAG TPA: ferritin-like domain-containing protein [Gemmatimonadales bacterium]|nr:ferritin-like domain-containing protein [Gemmatimonadales bacterium]